jgi:hypothetical protein
MLLLPNYVLNNINLLPDGQTCSITKFQKRRPFPNLSGNKFIHRGISNVYFGITVVNRISGT